MKEEGGNGFIYQLYQGTMGVFRELIAYIKIIL